MVMMLVIATVIILVLITNHKPSAIETPANEKPVMVEVEQDENDLIKFKELGFNFIRCYKGVTYSRYEFVPISFDDIHERVKELHEYIKDDKYIQIFILNPENEEEVVYLFEEGVVTWTSGINAPVGK